MNTSQRKIEHLLLCARRDVEAHLVNGERPTGFQDIALIHKALPEIDKKDLSMKVDFLGKTLEAPLLIASMTGGHPDTKMVNAALAGAAGELGIGIGVGSQRAALEDRSLEDTFRVVRDKAPHAFIYGNLGAAQLLNYGIEDIERAVEMIGADAMAIHLNFLQEAIQSEGNTNATGCLARIKEIAGELSVPVIVKETGAGISRRDALILCEAGVSAIDVGGMGGTSWAGVEVYRAREMGDVVGERLGELFWNWGIPTAVSIVEAGISIPIIATGGIRSGLDMAKAIALGASLCGIALPLVVPALKGKEEVVGKLRFMIEELRAAMFLTGCRNLEELKLAPVILTGKTRETLEERGFDTKAFARR